MVCHEREEGVGMRFVRITSRFWLQQVAGHGGEFNIVVQTNIAG
jgi:hypothetical protein